MENGSSELGISYLNDLQKIQEQLRATQNLVIETLNTKGCQDGAPQSLYAELEKLTQALAYERDLNTKLSADLSRSLDLNLKLQLEMEELRARSQSKLKEEEMTTQRLKEDLKRASSEIELNLALIDQLKVELSRTQEAFQNKEANLNNEIESLKKKLDEARGEMEHLKKSNKLLEKELRDLAQEKQQLLNSIQEFKRHSEEQNQVLKSVAELAQMKMNELQSALHKKSAECLDLQSKLDQALKHLEIVRNENTSLKNYFSRMMPSEKNTSAT